MLPLAKHHQGRRLRWAAALIVPLLASVATFNARAQAANSGVPLGGIGTGSIDLMPDGSFANATVNGNEAAPILRLDGCFAAVWSHVAERTTACVLRTSSAYALPCAPKAVFRPAFPRATLDFTGPEMPVAASLAAWSPIVPRDLRASSLPIVFLEVDVRNPGKERADVSVAFSWQHLSGVGGMLRAGPAGEPRPFGVGVAGSTLARYSNQNGLIGWRMEPGPIPDLPSERRFALNTRGTYLFAVDGQGLDAEVTSAGWNGLDGLGRASDAPAVSEAGLSTPPLWWAEFAATGKVSGTVGAGAVGQVEPACLVAVKLTLRPREHRTIPFIFAWHTPRRYLADGFEYGRACLRGFDDAADIARYAIENRQNLAALTSEWQERIRISTLPDWLAARIIDGAGILATSTLWTRDAGGDEAAPGAPVFGLINDSALGDIGAGVYAQPVLSAMAPTLWLAELRRSLDDAAKEGILHSSLGDLTTGIAKPGPPAGPVEVAAYVVRLALLYQMTGDKATASAAIPVLKRVLSSLSVNGIDETMAGALAHLAAADLAVASGDAALANEWARAGAGWQQSAERSLAAQPSPQTPSLVAVQLWAALLNKTLLNNPDTASKLLAAVVRDVPAIGSEPWQPSAAWVRSAWLIHQGKVEAALAAAKTVADLLARAGCVCRTPSLMHGDAKDARPANSAAGAASWLLLEALAGTSLDVPAQRLYLTPAASESGTDVRLPVFAPTFWATVTRQRMSAGDRVAFKLDRVLHGQPVQPASLPARPEPPPAAGVDVREVVLSRGVGAAVDVTARRGLAPLAGTVGTDERGRTVFVFDPPIHLLTGQRLEFVLRKG